MKHPEWQHGDDVKSGPMLELIDMSEAEVCRVVRLLCRETVDPCIVRLLTFAGGAHPV